MGYNMKFLKNSQQIPPDAKCKVISLTTPTKSRPEKKRKRLLDMNPVDWGPGTEKSSTEIDETVKGIKALP